jgi:hypothetical protein
MQFSFDLAVGSGMVMAAVSSQGQSTVSASTVMPVAA